MQLCDGTFCNVARYNGDLDIGWRPTDDTEDLPGGRLPLQCVLRLVESPHVLDGDDRLVGEGLHERDLSVRERANLVPPERQCAEQGLLPEYGDAEDRTNLAAPEPLAPLLRGVGGEVIDMHHVPGEADATDEGAWTELDRVSLRELDELGRHGRRRCGEREAFAVQLVQHAVRCAREARRVLDDGGEHRHQIGRRLADNLEDLGGRRLLLNRLR